MLKKISICGVLLALSCGSEENPTYFDAGLIHRTPDAGAPSEGDIWVCYSPGSQFHGKQCDEQREPGRCLTNGDSSKFCWKLDFNECSSNPQDLLYNEICEHF